MYWACIKQHAAEALSCFKNKGEDHISLNDEPSVLTMPPKSFTYVPLTVKEELETVEEPKGPFVRFL